MAWAELQRDCDDDGNGHDDGAATKKREKTMTTLVTSAEQDTELLWSTPVTPCAPSIASVPCSYLGESSLSS